MAILRKSDNPLTRHQKGKRWATATLVFCGAFSIWANVRSGQMNMESAIASVVPPIVAFLTSHLISYFSPTKVGHKVLVWGGFGLVTLVAMYGSGWHIFDYVVQTGQHWSTAISYVFITDAPMLFAAAVLVQKVSTSQTKASTASPAKVATAPKRTSAPKKTTAPKATKPTIVPNLPEPAFSSKSA